MLSILNRYLHGFVAIPVIEACRGGGLFTLLDSANPKRLSEIADKLGANQGHLLAALYLLESMGWVARKGEEGYLLCEPAEVHRGIPETVAPLQSFPFDQYLDGDSALSLQAWIELSQQRWNIQDQLIADFIDGVLVIPLLLTLDKKGLLGEATTSPFSFTREISPRVYREIITLFLHLHWLTEKKGACYLTDYSLTAYSLTAYSLTDRGRYFIERRYNAAIVFSYRPLLKKLPELIFGEGESVFEADAQGHERHVDRRLNVIGSGFQHERYFSDMEEVLLRVFDRQPLAEQPDSIADTGCGDGTLLKRVFDIVKNKSERGKALDRYPLTLIGIDINDKALEEAARTLQGMEPVLLRGDIGNPAQMIEDLKKIGIDDENAILHVRSFLDHDRPYIAPSEQAEILNRSVSFEGAFVDRKGGVIPAAAVFQSLVEHFKRWSAMVGRHGLIALEAHALPPKTVYRWLDKCESFYFDALQRFSKQLLVTAEEYLLAAAEAGLFCEPETLKTYPKLLPFSRITLQHFKPRPYRVRCARMTDLPVLVHIESECWPQSLRAAPEALEKRLRHYPQGQLVVEVDGRVVGVSYCQRIRSVQALSSIRYEEVESLHEDEGPLIQLLSINILPLSADILSKGQDKTLGDGLLEFALQRCSITSGVESAVGVSRCKNFSPYRRSKDQQGSQEPLPLDEYIHLRNSHGALVDPILRFHERHGAGIEGVLAGFRPGDEENNGCGVLIRYDLRNRKTPRYQSKEKATWVPVPPVQALEQRGSNSGFLVGIIKSCLGERAAAAFAMDRPFMEMGLDSADLLELAERISHEYRLSLDATFLFEHNTTEKVLAFIEKHRGVQREEPVTNRADIPNTQTQPLPVPDGLYTEKDIAIVGISCRLPGGIESLEALWTLLKKGEHAIGQLPADRWHWPEEIDPRGEHRGIDQGGFLSDIQSFDPSFFHLAPSEVACMDPQQRLMMQLSWEALEDAGYSADTFLQSRTGVFIGASGSDYGRLLDRAQASAQAHFASGNSPAVLANRLSYIYDLVGPSLQIDTACSSSLVALHNAVQSINTGESVQALVGGVNIMCDPGNTVVYYKAGMLAKDGRCKTFDQKADGYVRAEGAVMLLLKPATAAIRDRDHIYALIKGSAINHGGRAGGLTVPNPHSQAQLLRDAWRNAGVEPESIGFIEVHGTGTALGDPIEVRGLKQAFSGCRAACCGLSSIKTNIGHLEAAAGLAGLLKVVLSLKHRELPKSLFCEQLNEHIALCGTALRIVDRHQPWPAPEGQRVRRAGVSSFGSGGANAHVVLQEWPRGAVSESEACFELSGPGLFVLSARNQARLKAYAEKFLTWLRSEAGAAVPFNAMIATLQTGRQAMEERLAMVVADRRDLIRKLSQFRAGEEVIDRCHHRNLKALPADIVALTSGAAGEQMVVSAIQAQDLERLALCWVCGLRIDWKRLIHGTVPRRVSLPTYPFAQERYWIDTGAIQTLRKPAQQYPLLCFEETWVPCELTGSLSEQPVPAGNCLCCITAAQARGLAQQTQLERLATHTYILGDEESDAEAITDILRRRHPIDTLLFLGEPQDTAAIAALLRVVGRAGAAPKKLVLAGQFSDALQRGHLESWIGFERSLRVVWPDTQVLTVIGDRGLEQGKWMDALLREIKFASAGSVGYLEGRRHLPHLRPLPRPAERELRGNSVNAAIGQTVLITGGCGGLGLLFAEHLARGGCKNFILSGRSPLDAAQQKRILALQQRGSQVLCLRADISDVTAMRAGLKNARERFGAIDAVIHAAGVQGTGNIVDNDARIFQRVLAPKVRGTIVLDELLKDEPLQTVCYFSSSSAVLGDFGSCDYAVANRFLMAYARYRNGLVAAGKRSGNTLVINWPLWREGGMAGCEAADLYLKSSGQRLLETREGLGLFDQLLAQQQAQCLVLAGHPEQVRRILTHLSGTDGDAAQAPAGWRPGSAVAADLKRLAGDTLGMPAEQLDETCNLADYGFDSIHLARYAKALSHYYGWTITPAVFFGYSTLSKLTGYFLADHSDKMERFYGAGEIREDQKVISLYEEIANDGNSEFHGGYVTFFPFSARRPGFSITRVVMNPQRYPEEAALVREKQRESRQVLFRGENFEQIGSVLDFGCGYGTDVIDIAERYPHIEVHGYTITPSQAAFANQKIAEKKLHAKVFNRNSATDPFPGRYDLVFGIEVACHIEDKEGLFGNITGSIKENGRILLMDFIANLRGPIVDPKVSVYIPTRSQWGELLARHGLRIDEVVDLSPQIANSLHDPDCEANTRDLPPVLRDSWRNWTNNAVAIEKGWVSYCQIKLDRDGESDLDSLCRHNRDKLENPTPYPRAREAYVDNTEQATPAEHVAAELKTIFCRVLGLQAHELENSLQGLGLTSLNAVALLQEINTTFDLELPTSLIFEFNSIDALAAWLSRQIPTSVIARSPRRGSCPEPQETMPEPQETMPEPQETMPEPQEIMPEPQGIMEKEAIAVVGMSCRCAGASNLEEFWQLIEQGRACISEITDPRWLAYFDRHSSEAVPRHYGAIADLECFDPLFFRISPKEAKAMALPQRVLLQQCYHALEHAGIAPTSLAEQRAGTYIGYMGNPVAGEDWSHLAMQGSDASIMAARLAYFLNLKGPALAVDTACSSSLVAIDLARQALQSGEIDLAIAGGITLWTHPGSFISMNCAGILSPTGECKPFDHNANGTVVGEGAGIVVLKRLAEAERDGDVIYGVIRTSGTNQDGQTSGITVPSFLSQSQLQAGLYRKVSISAGDIQYVEAHGTGTSLGDPIEIHALSDSFSQFTTRKGFCGTGSLKANIGHTGAAAGVLSVIKVLLSLYHRKMPPSIHFTRANQHIDFENSPFYVNTDLRGWPANTAGTRLAAINSFGYSGTNAHAVLEGRDGPETHNTQAVGPFLVPLSARTPQALVDIAAHLKQFIDKCCAETLDLCSLAYTLQVGRDAMEERLAFVVGSQRELLEALGRFLSDENAGGVAQSQDYWRNRVDGVRQGNGSITDQQIDEWLTDVQLQRLAGAWVSGRVLEWRRLYGKTIPKRMGLPTYPFARDRYPAAESSGLRSGDVRVSQSLHPLLHTNTSDLSEHRFSSTFTGNEFFLAAHRVQGKRLLPAVACLEMARAAVERALPGERPTHRMRLHDIAWLRPIEVEDGGKTLHIRLFPEKVSAQQGERIGFEIYADAVHAQGFATLNSSESILPDRPAVQGYSPELGGGWVEEKSATECRKVFASMGITYGPAFQGIERVYVGEKQVLVKLALPAELMETRNAFVLHPALLDAALQPLIYLPNARGDALQTGTHKPKLPFTLARIEVWGACSTSMWALIRLDDSGLVEMELRDEAGRLCVEVKGLLLRALDEKSGLASDTVTQERAELEKLCPVWRPVSFAPGLPVAPSPGRRTVVVNAGAEPDRAIYQVYPDAQVLPLRDNQTIEVIAEQLQSLGGIDHLICLYPTYRDVLVSREAGCRERPKNSLASISDESLIQAQRQGVVPLFRLIKALLASGYASRALSWTLITSFTQEIGIGGGEEGLIDPTHAAVHGLAGSMAQEYPHWRIRLLDIAAWCRAPFAEAFTLPFSQNGEPLVYRGGHWYARTLVPFDGALSQNPSMDAEPPLYKHGGVYVVIGGAGGLGQAWSRWMLERYQAHIIWIGRRQENTEIRAAITVLAKVGPPPLYIQADASDPVSLQNAYRIIKQRYPHIHGLIHSAIVLRDKTLARMDERSFTAGLQAKVDVSVRMAQVFGESDCGFVLFFSSMASFLTLPGQSNYSAGCCFKDAFAKRLARDGSRPVKVMNWGYWGNVGIVRDTHYRERMGRAGIGSIEPDEGFESLVELLRSPVNQMALIKTLPGSVGAPAEQPIHRPAPEMESESLREQAEEYVKRLVASTLQMSSEQIEAHKPLQAYGMDSILVIQLTKALRQHFEGIGSTLFFEAQTVSAVVDYLLENQQASLVRLLTPMASRQCEESETAWQTHETAWQTHNVVSTEQPHNSRGDAAAIIGLSCRFPQAENVSQFWENLKTGRNSITEIPPSRWPWREYFDATKGKPGHSYSRWGGFIDNVDKFDPLFFQISPAEAEKMDPQERLFLETVHACVEDAGYTAAALCPGRRVGVFVGVMNNMYSTRPKAWSIANRVSYQFDFQGPSIALDTACSASLTALHLALESLHSGQCRCAIAGGVNLVLAPEHFIELSEMTALSPTDRCKPFGADADGFVDGEGVGAVLLKPLREAIADRDHIYAVLKGSTINAGGKTNGFTVPNPKAQARLVREALARAGVPAGAVSYVEAHGTGTVLGDPIEVAGLTSAFREQGVTQNSICSIGSVKSNIGHCESAAGIAGLTKVLLQMQHGLLVPSLHAHTPNPHIDFENTPFFVQQSLAEWQRPSMDIDGETKPFPRIASISSFGAGGANAYVVVEEFQPKNINEFQPKNINEFQPDDRAAEVGPPFAILLSAKTEDRLQALAARLQRFISEAEEPSPVWLSRIAYTLQVGREAMEERLALIVESREELEKKLKAVLAGENDLPGVYRGQIKANREALSLFQTDDDLKRAIDAWLAKRKYSKLLNLWVKGLAVDWRKLYGDSAPLRISLPTYPFARERYWAPASRSSTRQSRDSKDGNHGWTRLDTDTNTFERPTSEARVVTENLPAQTSIEELLLAPVWNTVLPPQDLPFYPSSSEPIVLVGGTQSQRSAFLSVYPQARIMEIPTGETIDALSAKLGALAPIDYLIWIAPEVKPKGLADDSLIEAQQGGAIQVFRLVKALLASGYGERKLNWLFITRQTLAQAPDVSTDPTHAAVHGLAGSLAQEYKPWRICLFDLEEGAECPVKEIMGLMATAEPDVLLYRHGEWLSQSLIPVAMCRDARVSQCTRTTHRDVLVSREAGCRERLCKERPKLQCHNSVYRESGVYVVIGGAGGIGEIWTRYMVETYRAQVIWIGRRQKDAQIQAKLDALAGSGPMPVYIEADASDATGLRDAVNQIKGRFARIHGVVHSAVGQFDQSLATMEEGRFREILSAKIDISVRLAQVFNREQLDFILFFSSVSAFIKSGGMSGYSAGCTFQDAYAQALSRAQPDAIKAQPRAVKVVNWGYWNVGTGVAIPESSKLRMEQLGIRPLAPSEGMAALETLLAAKVHQLVVMKSDNPQALRLTNPREWLMVAEQSTDYSLQALQQRLPGLPAPSAELKAAAVFYGSEMEPLLFRLLRATLKKMNFPIGTFSSPKAPAFYQRWLQQSKRFLSTVDAIADDTLENLWREWGQAKAAWLADANLRAAAVLAERCMRALPDILAGKRPATDVLFPDASMELVEGIYKGNLTADHFNDILGSTLVAWLEHRQQQKDAHPIRILEIGAGTGGTTASVLQKLKELQKLKPYREAITEYCYTDLSKAFLFHAREHYAPDNAFLTTHIFDVSKPVAEQKLPLCAYDVIIAANVLHATPNIRITLRNAKALLRSGGILLLNELSEASLLAHLTFGLLEGWWLNEDDALRIPGSPGLTPDTWAGVLKEEGFHTVIFPAAAHLELGQQIIAAESDGVVRQQGALDKAALSVPDNPRNNRGSNSKEKARLYVRGLVAELFRMAPERIDTSEPLSRYGIDSILIARLTSTLREAFGEISSSLLFDMQTVDALADYLLEHHQQALTALLGLNDVATVTTATTVTTAICDPDPVPSPQPAHAGDNRGIAIIGISGCYPQAPTLAVFWQNLQSGRHCITEIPEQRWPLAGFYEADRKAAVAAGKSYSKWGGFIEGFAQFDPLFFNISAHEAICMDPQERLFLQAVWAALEDAGITRAQLRHTYQRQVGVFAGVTRVGYGLYGPEVWQGGEPMFPYNSFSSVANRVSHFLDVTGPSLPIDTMCSSSLTAVHEACEHIHRGDCALAIAGGVNLHLHPSGYANLCANQMLSPDGRCKSFGLGGDGFVPGEGVGVVLLKPLARALEDRDLIHAVIRGTHVNHGGRTHGYTVPSPGAQAELIRRALDKAGVHARTVSYIEAHGTGTELGDPIEIDGLTQAFQQHTDATGFCAIGSVKSMLGHLEAAAGIAGLTKVILQMKHRQRVPSLHAEKLNPNIAFGKTPFVVQQSLETWRRPVVELNGVEEEYPRIAGVSSFGAGGTNAHIVLEEYIEQSTVVSREDTIPRLIVLSAKNEDRLRAQVANLHECLTRTDDSLQLTDLAYTLQVGREVMEERLGLVVNSLGQLRDKLRAFMDGDRVEGLIRNGGERGANTVPVFARDEDIMRVIETCINQREYSKLLTLWVQGHKIDWSLLYRETGARRISLPTYPFSTDRYWFTKAPGSAGAAAEKPISGSDREPAFEAQAPFVEPEETKTKTKTLLLQPCWQDSPAWMSDDMPVFREHIAGLCGLDDIEAAHLEAEGIESFKLTPKGRDIPDRYESLTLQLIEKLQSLFTRPAPGQTLLQVVVVGHREGFLFSGLGSLLRTARAENPAFTVQLIDIEGSVENLPDILRENRHSYGDDQVRYRKGTRQVLRLSEYKPAADGHHPWRENGIYLITGGLGGLGQIFAKEIAAQAPHAKLILCGRTAPANKRLEPPFEFQRVDVSVKSDVQALVRHIKTRYGRLNGILHCAGVIRDSAVAGKLPQQVQEVLAPKVAGTVYLDRASRAFELDLFVLFSSCASVQGNPGQADYAAANGFLDAYADYRQHLGGSGKTLCVNWPLWEEGGMQMNAQRRELLYKSKGMLPMAPAEGLRAFYEGLTAPGNRVVVVHGEAQKLKSLFAPSRERIRTTIIDIIREILLLGKETPLNEKATFLEHGIDSIHVVRFMRSLSEKLGLALAESLIFDYPTIGALADYLAGQGGTVAGARAQPHVNEYKQHNEFKELLSRVLDNGEERVALQVEGEGPLLFCIHPMSGDVGMYSKLAEVADNRFRMIGIKSKGFLNDSEPLSTLEDMGRHYADLIAEVDPAGPWHILGTSMGGTVAYEVVRHLQRRNGSVETLILIEAPLIETNEDAALWQSDEVQNLVMNANFLLITMLHLDANFRRIKTAGKIVWSDWVIAADEVEGVSGPALVDRLVSLIQNRGVTQDREVLEQRLESMAKIHLANLRALSRYRARPLLRPLEPRAVLLRSRSGDAVSNEAYNPDYLVNVQSARGGLLPFFEGWRKVLPRIKTEVVAGANHFDLLNAQNAAAQMAALIIDFIHPVSTAALRAPQAAQGIAIVGMSGRFPGAGSLDDLWRMLKNGESAFSPFPRDRGWEAFSAQESHGAFLDGIDRFDSSFFQISPKEAEQIDPAERLFLQEAWNAVEDAGVDPHSLSGARWGVFCGGGGDYTLRLKQISGVSPHVAASSIPGRVSYSFGLSGPCVAVDAGCASSLAAIAQACDQLVFGKCDVAIAGGVWIHSTPNLIQASRQSGLLSTDFLSTDFLSTEKGGFALDRRAQGMIPGEGVGVVVMKPLQKALADNDRIYGVIEAWGVNHSGKTNGMAAPSAKAQAALLTGLMEQRAIEPDSIGMVEANATGTPLGDQVEIRALSEVFGKRTDRRGFCALGSIENNIGHGFQSSGVARLLKVLLAMRHEEIPAVLNVTQPNEAIEGSPFFINRQNLPWPAASGPRRALVNSFGATGTNVQLILGDAPVSESSAVEPQADKPAGPVLIALSAQTRSALERRCRELADFVETQHQLGLQQLSASLLRRSHFAERCAFVIENRAELVSELRCVCEDKTPRRGVVGTLPDNPETRPQPLPEDFRVLADWYVAGIPFDLSTTFTAAQRRPVTLPAYPFEARPCWLHGPQQQCPAEVPAPLSHQAILENCVREVTGYKADEIDPARPLSRYGLDSLMGMRLLAIINERFGTRLQLADLVEHDTIAGLAALVDAGGSVNWLMKRLSA